MAKITLFWMIAGAALLLNLSEAHQHVVKEVVETDVVETDVVETDVYETDVVETDVYETDVYTRPHVKEHIEVFKTAPVVKEDVKIVEEVHRSPMHVTHHGLHGDRYVKHGEVHHPYHHHKDVVIKDVHKTRPATHVVDKKYVAAPTHKTTVFEDTEVVEEKIKFNTKKGSGEDDDPDVSDD